MMCPSCQKSQPMSFRCRHCGAPLMGGRYRGAAPGRGAPAVPVAVATRAAGRPVGAATLDNPYAAPAAAASPAPTIAREHQALASRGSRLAAALIDSLTPGVLLLPIFGGLALAEPGGDASALIGLITLGCVVALLAFVVYQFSLLVRRGQTLGKKLMNIRIVNYDDGEIPPWTRLLGLRYFLNGLLSQIGIYALVDVLFIFGDERRCLHDYLAGTKVVDA